MAEKVEIDIPGIGLIEAKNAATEATLLEILKVLENTQKDNTKNAKGKSGGSSSGPSKADAANMASFNKEQQTAGKSFSVLGAAAKGAGMAMNAVGKTAGVAVGGFNRMAGGAAAAAGATFTLGKNALDAGYAMTDLISRMAGVSDSTVAAANTLRMLGPIGGVLGGVFAAVAGAAENVVASYQKSASIGATFGGSVQAMSAAAGGAGMTLDKFAGLLASNSESLMLLGGTTEEGAKQFSQLAKGIQQSGVGSELQRLGYTTDQINGGMARYIGMLGKTGALQGMNTQQLVASSGAYMKELDALAKITGVSREDKEKEQQKLMKDGKIRAAMAGLDADQQKQMMAYITSFPQEQQGAIADMIATGNVTTEEAIKLQSLLPGVAQRTMEFGRTLQAGGKINQDTLNQAKNSAILEAKDSVKRNKARGLNDESVNSQYAAMADLAAHKVDGFSQALGEQAKATDKANLAENLTKAKQRLAEFSNSFQMALANSGMLDTLMNVFEMLGKFVLTTIVPIFNLFASALTTIIPMVTNFLTPAFQMLGEFVQNKIVPAFQILGAWVQDGLMPIFTRLWTIVTNAVDALSSLVSGVLGSTDVIEDVFEPALYAISDFIEDNLEPILTTLAIVAIPAVIAKMATMAMSMLGTIANFIALNLPMIGFTIAVGAMIYLFKKFGVDLGVVTDALKWAGSWISTLFLKLQQGIYTLLNKIPGMRGDFDNDLKGISEKLEENEKNRGKLEEDMAARRQKNLEDEAKKENSRDERDKKRGERREQREKAAIDRKEKAELGAIGAKEDREKAAEDAKNVTVDMSDPIQMLKTFAAKQKSAYTQEARAIEDKEKSQSELTMASQEMIKAKEQADKASTEEEKKAARDRIKAAEERLTKATEANKQADSAVDKAASRMKLAKEGKDPGAVAEGKAKEEKKTESGGASSTGKPTSDAKVPPINQDIQKNLEMVKAAMEKRGMTDPKYINATLANVMKETGGKVVEENLNYKNTSNDRIKSIFGSRAAGKSDKELDQIKSDPKQMGEMMYGNTTKIGKQMGNTEPGDGFKYRGRGNVQLTGKSNYAAASKAIYGDNRLVDNPDLVNDPAVAAEVTAWYMQKGQQGMAKTLGIDTKNMNQDQANQLATSQIAGRAIKRGEKGYLGEEVLGKVDKFSKDSKIAGIAGAPVSEETKKAMAEGKPKPQDAKSETKPEDAAKARADAAANDPRRTDKPATATAEGKPTTGDSASGSLQGLMKDGIVPTTLAFQDLVNKGIKPFQGMLSGVQVKTPLKGEVPAKESLSPGEELVKATAEAQAKLKTSDLPEVAKKMADAQAKIAQESNKTKGMYDKDAASTYVSASDQAKLKTSDLPEVAKKMAEAQARDPGTGELLSAAKDLSSVVTKQDSSSDQAKAVKDSLIESSKFMFSGFDMFATDLSTSMTKTFDFVGTDLSSTFSDTLKLTMDDSLGLFTTDLSDNFAAFETLDLPSMVTGLDDYTKQIYAASDEIAKGEANIAQQEAAIATASANLQDPSITNKDEIAAAVAAMQDNIQLQKSTIAYNKDVIDKNIMARAETPLTELVAQANKDAQEKIRLAEEAASEKEKQSEATVMASSQEGSGDSASDLNTALAELIAISRKTADLNEKQLSVQSSLSGDLFA